jgi:hypothetical protein
MWSKINSVMMQEMVAELKDSYNAYKLDERAEQFSMISTAKSVVEKVALKIK